PVAVLHGLGTGTDTKVWWMLGLTVVCVAAVSVAVLARIVRSDQAYAGLRVPAAALTLAAPVGLAIFTLAGPLAHGWARRAGTPPRLLGRAFVSASVPTGGPTNATLKTPFSAR